MHNKFYNKFVFSVWLCFFHLNYEKKKNIAKNDCVNKIERFFSRSFVSDNQMSSRVKFNTFPNRNTWRNWTCVLFFFCIYVSSSFSSLPRQLITYCSLYRTDLCVHSFDFINCAVISRMRKKTTPKKRNRKNIEGKKQQRHNFKEVSQSINWGEKRVW